MDFIMGLPKTERQHDAIFTFVDRLTKYVHVIPTKSTIDAEGPARFYVHNVFAYHRLSKSIVSDRDPRFTSAFFKEVFSLLRVELNMSTANHPQTDGMTVRVNRIVEDTLRSFVNHRQTNWDELLALCQFSMNNSFSTFTEDTPFYLTSGQHPVTLSTLVDCRTSCDFEHSSPRGWLQQREAALQLARDCLVSAQARQAFYRPIAYSIFRKGDVMSGSRGWSGRVFAARSLPSTSVCFLHDKQLAERKCSWSSSSACWPLVH